MQKNVASGSHKEDVLREVLANAWRNVQHHNAARLGLVCLYFVFAAAALAFLMLANGTMNQNLIVTLFVTVVGFTVIGVAVRYKERIVRDMRIVFKGMEKSKKSVASRLSSTRHLLLTIELLSSVLVALAVQPEVVAGWFGVLVVGMFVLFLHEMAFMLTRRGLAFNI